MGNGLTPGAPGGAILSSALYGHRTRRRIVAAVRGRVDAAADQRGAFPLEPSAEPLPARDAPRRGVPAAKCSPVNFFAEQHRDAARAVPERALGAPPRLAALGRYLTRPGERGPMLLVRAPLSAPGEHRWCASRPLCFSRCSSPAAPRPTRPPLPALPRPTRLPTLPRRTRMPALPTRTRTTLARAASRRRAASSGPGAVRRTMGAESRSTAGRAPPGPAAQTTPARASPSPTRLSAGRVGRGAAR